LFSKRHVNAFITVASLLNVHGQRALRLLFSRRSHYQFDYGSLLTILPIYFILACWASGSALASGIVVPKLYVDRP
jgi:chloride channel 7